MNHWHVQEEDKPALELMSRKDVMQFPIYGRFEHSFTLGQTASAEICRRPRSQHHITDNVNRVQRQGRHDRSSNATTRSES